MASVEDSYSSDDSYIAWDGARYPGSPPAGWYLAVDNRWWPPQEVIDEGVPEVQPTPQARTVPAQNIPTLGKVIVDDHASGGTTSGSAHTARPEVTQPAAGPTKPVEAEVDVSEAEQPTPSADWAPETARSEQRRSQRSQPGQSSPPPSQPSQRRRRRRRGNPIRNLMFVAVAFLLVRACNASEFEEAISVGEATEFDVAVETTVATTPPMTGPDQLSPTIVDTEDEAAIAPVPTKDLLDDDIIFVTFQPNGLEVTAQCTSFGVLTTQVEAPGEPADYTLRYNVRVNIDGVPTDASVEEQLTFPLPETGGFGSEASFAIAPGLCAIDSVDLLEP